MHYYCVLIFTLLHLCTPGNVQDTGETTEIIDTTPGLPIILLTDLTPSVEFTPSRNVLTIVQNDEGFNKIAVTVTECNTDGANGEYAAISTSEDLLSEETITFIYEVTNKPFYLFNTTKIYVYFAGTSASNFTINCARIGEVLSTSTTDLPTTTDNLPTPSVNDSADISVYLAGKNIMEYQLDETTDLLREMISEMAIEYCEEQRYDLIENITRQNVKLWEITQCNLKWPNHEICVRLTFAVPVQHKEGPNSPWSGYQLDSQHLQIMWDRCAKKHLKDGLTVYVPPNLTSWLKWQLFLFGSVTVLFVICLLVIRHYSIKVTKIMRRRKHSDTTSIVSSNDRNSQLSLPPHYLQETPALFENAYPMYNPEKGPTYGSSGFSKTLKLPDYPDSRVAREENSDSELSVIEESGA